MKKILSVMLVALLSTAGCAAFTGENTLIRREHQNCDRLHLQTKKVVTPYGITWIKRNDK